MKKNDNVDLWAYTIAGNRRAQGRSNAECAAVGAVIGLVAGIAAAFPTQALWGRTISSEPPPVGPSETVVTFATWWGLAFGLPSPSRSPTFCACAT